MGSFLVGPPVSGAGEDMVMCAEFFVGVGYFSWSRAVAWVG
jgi:hypothetical protein